MDISDKPLFMTILQTVWDMCGDPLNDIRQRGYWWVLKEECSITEFESACRAVLAETVYHKTPLPGVILAHVKAQRAERKRQERMRAQAANESPIVQAAAQHQRLLADPAERERYDQHMRACLDQLNSILGANWRTLAELDAAGEARTRQRRARQQRHTWPAGPEEDTG